MKQVLWCSLFVCSAAFAQNTAGNAAADSLQKRFQSMSLLNPPKRLVRPALAMGANASPEVCSILLLEAKPAETNDKMKVTQPKLQGRPGDVIAVPAPPCVR
jgi:hypothetical protein